MWARQLVIPQLEDEGEWQSLLDGVIAEYAPVGATELEIVVEIASQMWTRRRIRRAANAEIQRSIQEMPAMYEPSARLRGEAIKGDTPEDAAEFQREADRRLVPDERVLDRVIRYQAHTTRQIEKLTAELRTLQAARQDEETGKTWIEVRKKQD